MAMYRYGSATVVEPSVAPQAWQQSVCCGHKGACACGTKTCRVKLAKTVLAKYSPEKWLLSHCSIMAAVDTELADPKDPKSDWMIHPAYSQFVNNNGDAWSKQMLAACYKTFIGANNYCEHIQIQELSKGKVIDAALREVTIGKDASGKDLTTYYVDILIATERKHKDLVANIESGKVSHLSMGCKIAHSTCSKCGKKAVDETQACAHVRYEKNSTFIDTFGVTRKVAELCLPGNCKVLTRMGYSYINEIKIGDEVVSHTGAFRKVSGCFIRPYVGDMVQLKVEGLARTIVSTPDHPHYVFDGKRFLFKKASEITFNDFLVKKAPEEKCTFADINENRSWLLGLYIAEGSGNDNRIEFSLNSIDEKDLAGRIMELLLQEFPPEVNRLRDDIKDWQELKREKGVKPVKRTIYGKTLVQESFVCPVCGAPADYIVFLKNGRIKCHICKSQSVRDTDRCSVPHLYEYPRKYAQNFIGGRPIKMDNSNKLTIRYYNRSCYNFFKKYCPGTRAYSKKPSFCLLSADKVFVEKILIGWLKGDGSTDKQLRLRGYTTSEAVYQFMELAAVKLNYWNRCQLVFQGKKVDLGDFRDLGDTADVVDIINCHAQFQLFFSPRDCSSLYIGAGFSESYPVKRKETRKNGGFLLYKIRGVNIESFSGNVYNLSVEQDNSFIVDGIVTHNCGHFSEPGSVVFIDASWVANPAFTGAVRRNTIAPSSEIMAKIEKAHSVKSFETQETDYLKVAAEGDPPPEEPSAEELPAEEVPAVDAPADPGADPNAPADTPADPGADPNAPPAPPPEPLPSPDDIPTWKSKIKKKLLDELGSEIMEEFIEDLSMGGGGPRGLDTLDDNMIRPTASQMLRSTWRMRNAWDKYMNRVAGHLDKKNFDRLKYGTYMLLTSNDLTSLKDYGYSRRDFLAVMSFLDDCFKTPMARDVRKALSKTGSTTGRTTPDVIKELSWWTGRTLSAGEAIKALTWLKLMDAYTE